MATAAQTHAVVVARMHDGSIAFLSRLRTGDMLRSQRNLAWVMTIDEAHEAQTRLNGVIDLGQCHREVAFFDVCVVKPTCKTRRNPLQGESS